MDKEFFIEKKGRIFHLIFIFAFSYLFLFHGLGNYSLKEPDEGRYAEIPREMIELGNYLVPHLNYVPYFEKPPLFYWIVALSYLVFGVNEFSYRLPNALFSFLSVLVVYLFSKRKISQGASLFSALILLSSFGFFAMSRIVTLDMAFTAFLTLSLFSFAFFYLEGKKAFLWLFYIFCALATLTKGFVAPLLLLLTVVIFLWSEGDLAFIRRMRILHGSLIFLLIVGPYFFYMSFAYEDFFHFFFIDQHILRYLTTKHKRPGPFYYFLAFLFIGALPYSVFIPRALLMAIKKRETKLLTIWTLVILTFFSLSGSKLPPYILPLFPSLSIILGIFFVSENERIAMYKAERFLYILLFATLGLFFLFLFRYSPFPVFKFSKVFIFLSIISFTIMALLLFLRSLTLKHLFVSLFVFSSLISSSFLLNMDSLERVRTTKPLAQLILSEKKWGDIIVNYGTFDRTLPFYCRSRVLLVNYTGELEHGMKRKGIRPLDENEFFEIFNSEKRVFLVIGIKKLPYLMEKIGEKLKVKLCTMERCLVTNF